MVNKKELKRKIGHINIGIVLVFAAALIYRHFGREMLVLSTYIAMLLALVIDSLISQKGYRIPIYAQLERPEERKGMHTATLGVLGFLITLLMFDIKIVFASALILVLGDGIAGLAGVYFKKEAYRFLTMFFTSLLATIVMLDPVTALTMSIVAAIVENYFVKVNDNLAIPVFTSFAGYLIRLFL